MYADFEHKPKNIIQQNDAHPEDKDAQLKQKDVQIAQHINTVQQLTAQLKEKDDRLRQKKEELQQMETQLQEKSFDINILQRKIEILKVCSVGGASICNVPCITVKINEEGTRPSKCMMLQ